MLTPGVKSSSPKSTWIGSRRKRNSRCTSSDMAELPSITMTARSLIRQTHVAGDDALRADKQRAVVGDVPRDAAHQRPALARHFDLTPEHRRAFPPLFEGGAPLARRGDTVELVREIDEQPEAIRRVTRESERRGSRAQLRREVVRTLMHVHADPQHQRTAFPIRGRVGECTGDLLMASLDVVGPF